MVASSKNNFGAFAKKARLAKELGLRQAAREMNISAAYLSRVENNVDDPSGLLIQRMSALYGISIEKLADHAQREKASVAAHRHAMEARPDLRALYRLGTQVDSQEIEKLIRKVLREKGVSEEDIEKRLALLKSELPRVRNSSRDGLFAAEARPRVLARRQIEDMARETLERNDLGKARYSAPTPVELLVENEPGISYRIDELKCDHRGDPLVLGLTKWDEAGNRQIVVNSVLADSRRSSDCCRFSFTLAHELFHAIEHLPRASPGDIAPIARKQEFVEVVSGRRSAAERAVIGWAKDQAGPRQLATDEDWREWQANTFASALLMPSWAVREEFRKRVGADKIVADSSNSLKNAALDVADRHDFGDKICEHSLAELFAVSRQAMAIRLLQLGLVQEGNG